MRNAIEGNHLKPGVLEDQTSTAVKRTTRAQSKIPTNVESFTLTAKLNAASENVECVLKMK